MNYIWEPLIKMMQQNIDLEALHYFVKNNRVSPYLELQGDSLHEEKLSKDSVAHMDVNPYARFPEIFNRFITSDDMGYEEFNQGFADVLLHYQADLDLKAGMSKREFYIRFITRDMEHKVFGNKIDFSCFTVIEKRAVADGVLSLYETSSYINCLIKVLQCVLPFCQILIRDDEEIVFYMREEENKDTSQKIQILIKLFLPLNTPFVLHWEKTYGVSGYSETMRLGEFVV